MYPKHKKTAIARATQIVLGASVLLLVGAVAFCVLVSRGGGAGFKNLISGGSGGSRSSDSPLSSK